MAIVLNTEASNTSSVNNEMLFVAYEATKAIDPVTYPDYAYVCDVYVSGAIVGRLIARPDPEYNRGIFDVAPILREYCSYGLDASAQSVDYTPYLNYQLKFGEQYNGTLYTNLLVDGSDRQAFETYKAKPFTSSAILTATGLATDRPQQSYHDQDTDYLLVPYFLNATGTSSFDITYRDAAGNNLATQSISSVGQAAKTIRQINVHGLARPAAATVAALAIPNVAAEFIINYQCTKYTPYVLAWLNHYGAYESQSFGFVSKKILELTKKTFEQQDYRINSSGVVSYQANNVFYGGKKGYNTRVKISMNLTSHLLSEGEYTWLADLFKSPDVYIYDTTEDKFLPVVITGTNYEYRSYLNSRLVPLQFTVEFSTDHNSQFL